MSKVAITKTRVPYTTIDAIPAVPAHMARTPAGFVPAILQRILPDLRRPLSQDTVQRVLTRAIDNSQSYYRSLFGVSAPRIITWGTLPDGTTVAIVEDHVTGIRHMWSLHNETFEPVSYGMVDA